MEEARRFTAAALGDFEGRSARRYPQKGWRWGDGSAVACWWFYPFRKPFPRDVCAIETGALEDIKPENNMLCAQDPVTLIRDWVKILDFGIAKIDLEARRVCISTAD